jgi:hypothetical protein
MKLKMGDLARVKIFGGDIVIRQVVATENNLVAVTTPEEYERAVKEKRKPISIGFPAHDVMAIKRASPSHEQ